MRTDNGLAYDQDTANGNAATVGFYVGLIGNDFTESGALDVSDIGSSLTEFTDYSATARLPLSVAASASGVANADPLIFTVNANSSTVYGAFIVSYATKADAANGFIYAVKKFASPLLRDAGQDITINLTLTMANA